MADKPEIGDHSLVDSACARSQSRLAGDGKAPTTAEVLEELLRRAKEGDDLNGMVIIELNTHYNPSGLWLQMKDPPQHARQAAGILQTTLNYHKQAFMAIDRQLKQEQDMMGGGPDVKIH